MGAKGFELRKIDFFPSINRGQPLDYLKGSIGGVNTVDIEFDQIFSYEVESGQNVKVLFLGFEPLSTISKWRFEIQQPDKEFEKLFSIGDFIGVDHSEGLWNYEGDVSFVSDSAIEVLVTGTGSGAGQNIEGNYNEGTVLFRNYKVPELFEIRYNLGPSSRPSQTNLFDGGQQIYASDFSGIEFAPVTRVFTPKTGSVNNWRFLPTSPSITLKDIKPDPQINGVHIERGVLKTFKIESLDLIIPYWNDGFAENYEDSTIPDIFKGEETLKLYFELKVYLTKDKKKKPTVYKFEREADIGWLNENGNGGFTDLRTDSINYTDVSKGIPSEGLSSTDSTIVNARIYRNTGVFSTQETIQITLFKKVDFEEYSESKLNNFETYLYGARRIIPNGQTTQGINSIGTIKRNISSDGKRLALEFSHQATAYSKTRIEQGDEYVLLATFYNSTGEGESTAILLDQGEYSVDTDQSGLIRCIGGRVLDPDVVPDNNKITLQNGYSSSRLWNEDGVIAYWKLLQLKSVQTEILSLKFRLISNRDSAKNGSTDYLNPEDYLVIQEKDIPFNIVGSSQNVPIYEGEELRAFNLDDDDIFKLIKVQTDPAGFVAEAEINIQCAFKVDWQNWVRLNNVPFDFYNPNDSFEGYNKRSSNYSEKPQADEFNIYAVLVAEMKNNINDFTTEYAFEVPIKVYNYGEDQYTRQGLFADWTAEGFTEKADGTDLNLSVLTSEDTVFKIHWINNGRTTETDFYFIHRIEESLQPAFDIFELSTLREAQNNNPLQPLQGDLNLRIIPDGSGGFFSECKIDYTQLKEGTSYKLSGRIGKNEDGTGEGFGFSVGFTIGFNS